MWFNMIKSPGLRLREMTQQGDKLLTVYNTLRRQIHSTSARKLIRQPSQQLIWNSSQNGLRKHQEQRLEFKASTARSYVSLIPGLDFNPEEEEEAKSKNNDKKTGKEYAKQIFFKCFETAGITMASLTMLGLTGWLYQQFYQANTVHKIEKAFNTGDPAYLLTMHSKRTGEEEGW